VDNSASPGKKVTIMTEPPRIIAEFRGAWAGLSSFHPSPLAMPGYPNWLWPGAEYAYQAQKRYSGQYWHQVMRAATPGDAKRIGRATVLRTDWEQVKKRVMFDVVWAKFTQNPDLAAMLLATGDATLIEGNTWNDRYWGQVNGQGHNYLGRILMATRMLLRED
jgi:ribA/ribD-fused uncharacterized protein